MLALYVDICGAEKTYECLNMYVYICLNLYFE